MNDRDRHEAGSESVDELARKLVEARKFREAGAVLLKSVGGLTGLQALAPEQRRRAHRAAICFSNCGDVECAAEVLWGLGETERATKLLEEAGRGDEVSRLHARPAGAPSARQTPPSAAKVPGPVVAAAPPAPDVSPYSTAPTELLWKSRRPSPVEAPPGDPSGPRTPEPSASAPSPREPTLPGVGPERATPAPVRATPAAAAPALSRPGPNAAGRSAAAIAPELSAPALDAAAFFPPAARTPAPSAPVESIELPDAGTIVSSRFRLDRSIGQGGTAYVFQATDLELKVTVAIKFIRREIADANLLERFKAEVTLSRQLNHPNIIRLYDLGSHQGLKYITMELLEGSDLHRVIGSTALELAQGLDLLTQACSGLQAVHDAGVIHRDVKPENLFVTSEGVLKVMDFGLAKRYQVPGQTVAGMLAGTPEYMSPEQIKEFSKVTHQADIYSLGCIAYRMFTGVLPFQCSELVPMLVAHLTDPPTPPRKHNPRLPSQLERLILDMMEKKPSERPGSCREIVERLSDLRR